MTRPSRSLSNATSPPTGFLAELETRPAPGNAETCRLQFCRSHTDSDIAYRFHLATAPETFPYDLRVFDHKSTAGVVVPLPGGIDEVSFRTLAGSSPRRIVDALAPRVHCALLVDRQRGRLMALQGLFGRFPLVFHRTGTRLVVATDPDWLCRREAIDRRPDRSRLIRFLRASFDHGRGDFVAGLSRIRHGECIRWQIDLESNSYLWKPSTGRSPSADVSRELLDRLLESLARRIDGGTVLSLSDGFDSCTLAALASTHLDTHDTGRLPTASMVAPHLEALAIEDRLDWLAERFPLETRRFDVGSCWPLRDCAFHSARLATGPIWHPGEFRGTSFYRWLRETFDAETVVTGSGLETLFQSTLAQLIRQLNRGPWTADNWRRAARLVRRPDTASGEVMRRILRAALRRAVGDGPPLSWLRRFRPASRRTPVWRRPNDWVHPLADENPELALAPADPPPTDCRLRFLQSWGWELSTRGMFRRSIRSGVEMRLPYLDADLGEFALALRPADLMTDGDSKGLFVDVVCRAVPSLADTRESAGYFDQLIQQSLAGYRRQFVDDLFTSSYLGDLGIIDPFVFREAFDAYCRAVWRHGNRRPVGSFPVWSTIAAELWLRALDGADLPEDRRQR